jgi:hypothetical protein
MSRTKPEVSANGSTSRATVAPTNSTGSTPSEAPHLAGSARRRNILLAIIFLPPIGVALAWLSPGWPTWARVIATVWALLVPGLAVALALDVFGPRGQGNVSATAEVLLAM